MIAAAQAVILHSAFCMRACYHVRDPAHTNICCAFMLCIGRRSATILTRAPPSRLRAPAPSGPPYVIHASIREPLARTRATPTPSTSHGSTSCSFCRKVGISSCSTSRIWAGGHLRASVNWITSGVFTMMMSRACAPSRIP
eukprot:scaffold5181_cov125-Isochrysis_galbana.AAC.8